MKLNEICEVYSGYALKSFNDIEDGLPVVKIGNILTDGTLDLKECQYTTDNVSEKYYSNKDDIYIALSGATTGKIGIMDTDEKYVINQRVGIVRKKSDDIPQEYIKYFLLRQTDRILKEAAGCAQPNISPKQIAEYKVPETSKERMQEMCDVLDKTKKIIDSRKAELTAIDELIKARFVEMFGDPMVNPKGYSLKSYGDLFELNAGGTPSKAKPEYWEDGTIPWIGSNLCQNEILYENDGKYISQEGYDHSSARIFPVDTVLIALVGATIGKTALLKFETSTNQNVLGVRRIAESGYNSMFVYYYTQFLYQKFINIGDGGFNMASKGFVSELPMYVVDLSVQNEFAAFAEHLDKLKLVVQNALKETELLFDSLMQQYFG